MYTRYTRYKVPGFYVLQKYPQGYTIHYKLNCQYLLQRYIWYINTWFYVFCTPKVSKVHICTYVPGCKYHVLQQNLVQHILKYTDLLLVQKHFYFYTVYKIVNIYIVQDKKSSTIQLNLFKFRIYVTIVTCFIICVIPKIKEQLFK